MTLAIFRQDRQLLGADDVDLSKCESSSRL